SFLKFEFWISEYIRDLNGLLFLNSSRNGCPASDSNWVLFHELFKFSGKSVAGYLAVHFTELAVDRSHFGFAQPGCRLDQRIENNLKIKSGAADDLQHIRSGGLLLQLFAQFIQQPCILNRDDGLIGKILPQRNLFVGEWGNFCPIDRNSANQVVVFEHRYG